MATDDKKEYRDVLLLLSHMGSGHAVINKLDQLTVKMEDPRLRDTLKKMAQYFREQPELAHAKKFRLLDFARNYSMNAVVAKRRPIESSLCNATVNNMLRPKYRNGN